MGHLTRIANTVVHHLEKGPVHTQISNIISGTFEGNDGETFNCNKSHRHFQIVCDLDAELPEDYRGRWETFVDHTLSETNRKNTIDLVITCTPTICARCFYSVTEK